MSIGKTNTLTIKTPEGIVFSLLLASPITRFFAWSIDLGVILVITGLVGKFMAILQIISVDIAAAANIFSYFVISIGYAIALEWFWRGQTLGKRLLRLRVMDAQGLRLTFSQIVMRNLVRVVDSMPALYLVGGLTALFSKRAQRLGDLAANTIVVWYPEAEKPDLDQVLAGKYNSFSVYPHLEARLRQRVSPREASIALQALLRRDELDPRARIELFHDIANHFKKISPFPQEATDGVSDEQYVRNAVDVLFNDHGERRKVRREKG